jgi:hypothetical protein
MTIQPSFKNGIHTGKGRYQRKEGRKVAIEGIEGRKGPKEGRKEGGKEG